VSRRNAAATILVGAVVALAAPASAEERADYMTPDALPEPGASHLLAVSMIGSYARVVTPESARGISDAGAFGLRSRLHLFRPVSYCTGLDADVGGTDEGTLYGLTAYVLGIGGRWGDGNVVSLCGGAGFDGVGVTTLPIAAHFPVELSGAFDLGPIRPSFWVRPVWLAGREMRRRGTDLSFVDELELGLAVRIARQHPYWSGTSGGAGLVLGVTYRQFMRTAAIGGFIGIEIAGEQ
jgi:hypothetical protein